MQREFTQPELVGRILKYIDKTGWEGGLNCRQMNAIIAGANVIIQELDRPHVAATPGMGWASWLSCDDTGRSSVFMCRVLTGGQHGENYCPADPADFGRCIGLLDAAPVLRPSLPMLRNHGPQWTALVDAWTELEALYREELPSGTAPKLFARMRELLEPLEGK